MNDGAKLRLAIVDDDASVRRGLKRMLMIYGHTVHVYAGGQEFLDATDRDGVDCAIFDLRMPRMSGLQVLMALRTRGSELPVVLMTADAESFGPGMAEGANMAVPMVLKPFTSETLFMAIRTATSAVPA